MSRLSFKIQFQLSVNLNRKISFNHEYKCSLLLSLFRVMSIEYGDYSKLLKVLFNLIFLFGFPIIYI